MSLSRDDMAKQMNYSERGHFSVGPIDVIASRCESALVEIAAEDTLIPWKANGFAT